ncbi:MAG: CPBP family intramembrane metalloprotease [Oscillospiraceae bacterium]|jgi:membrane protease YdiL (CAAX protease family)|nr:CPBP family intramembrane metalloprotease [Oscillospiraceae bacterium]
MDSFIPPPSKVATFFRSLLPPLLYTFVIQGFAMYLFIMPDLIKVYEETGVLPNTDVNTVYNAEHFPHALLFGALGSIVLFQFILNRNRLLPEPGFRQQTSAVPYVLLVSVAGNFVFTSGITALQLALGTDFATSSLDGVGENADMFLLLLTSSIFVPIAEELCFRALTLGRLLQAFPPFRANLIQAAIFGLVHGTPIAMGYAFLFGLFLGTLYQKTGRLGLVILSHIAFNSASLLLSIIPGIAELLENAGGLMLFIFTPSLLLTLFGLMSLRKIFPKSGQGT